VSPKRVKKPPRPKSKAAKQRSRRARQGVGRSAAPKKAPKRTAKRESRATRRAAAAATRAAKPARKAARRAGKAAGKPARGGAMPARKPARRAAPARRAELKIVPPRAPQAAKPRPRPFAGAIAGASAKDLAIFDLVRARVEVQAALQGLQPAAAEIPVGEGKWTPRAIVLHLHYWDREMLPYVERAWRHDERPPHTKEQILAENDRLLDELGAHDWDEARRLMQHSREAFLEALQSVPEEPGAMWSSDHALGWLIRILSHHDRHHAAVLKDARSRGNSTATESS